jgi:hypothetical protein
MSVHVSLMKFVFQGGESENSLVFFLGSVQFQRQVEGKHRSLRSMISQVLEEWASPCTTQMRYIHLNFSLAYYITQVGQS